MGPVLMKLTESKQVNAFLSQRTSLKNGREKPRKLQSPYFDFEHEKVKEALKNFMNVLSGYMSIRKEDLEPLSSTGCL